jgi:hypothetical protein
VVQALDLAGNRRAAACVQSGMRTLPVVVVLALASGAVSCGDRPTPAERPTGAASTTQPPTTEVPLNDPTPVPTGKRPATTTTVTGVVAAGAESGCLLLDTGSETLLLVGVRPEDAPEGARVRVTGGRDPLLATTCQQGVPFLVQQVTLLE